ncbi:sensor histidine kinase [Paenibacillus lignilyticus]
MSSIITNYDQFIKSGKINRADTDIMEVIQEALVLTSIRIKEKNVIMDLSEQRRMAASMDKDKMRQVFTNLINNSIEAMEGKERKVIKITIFSKNNEGTIIFADTGAGVAREEWDRIFTPFHTTKDTGMGLGLSISQRILNSHGGYIEILKSDASGTEFKVSIPLIDYKTFVTGQDMDAK